MIKIARFYQPSATDHSKLVEACGTDSLLHLDGRWGMAKQHMEAKRVCKQRGYVGYVLQVRADCTTSLKDTCALVRI